MGKFTDWLEDKGYSEAIMPGLGDLIRRGAAGTMNVANKPIWGKSSHGIEKAAERLRDPDVYGEPDPDELPEMGEKGLERAEKFAQIQRTAGRRALPLSIGKYDITKSVPKTMDYNARLDKGTHPEITDILHQPRWVGHPKEQEQEEGKHTEISNIIQKRLDHFSKELGITTVHRKAFPALHHFVTDMMLGRKPAHDDLNTLVVSAAKKSPFKNWLKKSNVRMKNATTNHLKNFYHSLYGQEGRLEAIKRRSQEFERDEKPEKPELTKSPKAGRVKLTTSELFPELESFDSWLERNRPLDEGWKRNMQNIAMALGLVLGVYGGVEKGKEMMGVPEASVQKSGDILENLPPELRGKVEETYKDTEDKSWTPVEIKNDLYLSSHKPTGSLTSEDKQAVLKHIGIYGIAGVMGKPASVLGQ